MISWVIYTAYSLLVYIFIALFTVYTEIRASAQYPNLLIITDKNQ